MVKKEEKEEKEEILEKLKKDFQECEKQKNDYLAGWQRAQADFLNYKKEEAERVENFLKYAQEEFIFKILPVLDNFEIAEKKIGEDLKEDDENIKGLLQIKIQIQDLLKSFNVEEVKSIGENFNPDLHEAIEEIAGEGPFKSGKPGTIIEEIQKGYKINDRLLRPAKVKVIK